jgi:hypothetical protein
MAVTARVKNPTLMAGKVLAFEVIGDLPEIQCDPGETLSIEIKRPTKARSLSANAYFHVLVDDIAAAMRLGNDEVKRNLVLEYGTLARDGEGVVIGFKLPASVDVSTIYDYAKVFKTVEEGGKMFNCYLVYKRTRDMLSNEFSRLLDGAIAEAKELGIETATPMELARMKEDMRNAERRAVK